MVGEILLDSFHVVKRIAAGGFGIVDEGVDANNARFAIKRELASHKVSRPILEHEYHVLQSLAGHDSIPIVKGYGSEGSFNILVMDLFGRSLSDLFRDCANRFSLRTTARLGIGMSTYTPMALFIATSSRKISCSGSTPTPIQSISLISVSRRWRVVTPGTLVSSTSVEEDSGVIGTLPYASQHAHLGLEQTRRDDLHAFAYTILLFFRGNLPWDHIRGGTQKHCARRILEKKRSWTAARLCQGLPHEFEELCSHCLSLGLNERPDYEFLRAKLNSPSIREGGMRIPDLNGRHRIGKLSMIASAVPEVESRPLKPPPNVSLKRGDIVLLRISPQKTLDYEPMPRDVDPSFFPHHIPNDGENINPFRPLSYDNLDGLSRRPRVGFRPVESFIEVSSRSQERFEDVYLYTTSLLPPFGVEYEQASNIRAQLSLSNEVLEQLEADLARVPAPYSLVYDSDDNDTRAIRRRLPKIWSSGNYITEIQTCMASDLKGAAHSLEGVNGWIPDILYVEELRYRENGEQGPLVRTGIAIRTEIQNFGTGHGL